MAGTSRPCQRYSRGPAKLKDGFRIMFDLLYTASERVAKRAGFCVDSWLRSLLAAPLRFEPRHDVFPQIKRFEPIHEHVRGRTGEGDPNFRIYGSFLKAEVTKEKNEQKFWSVTQAQP
jgi:hypothetical protein